MKNWLMLAGSVVMTLSSADYNDTSYRLVKSKQGLTPVFDREISPEDFTKKYKISTILYSNGNLGVYDKKGQHPVNAAYIDPELRNRSFKEIAAYLQAGNRIKPFKMHDGTYGLHAVGQLPGGLAGAATVLSWGVRVLLYGGMALAFSRTRSSREENRGGGVDMAEGVANALVGGFFLTNALGGILGGPLAGTLYRGTAGGLGRNERVVEGARLMAGATVVASGGMGVVAFVEKIAAWAGMVGMVIPWF
jgi:hypothetical protein